MSDNPSCPVCDTSESEKMFSVNSDEAARHFRLPNRDMERFSRLRNHIETLWQGSLCTIYRCSTCGFQYAYPYIAGDSKFYDLAYDRSGYPKWKFEYERTVSALNNLSPLPEGSGLIEIGAGNGAFLKVIADRFFERRDILSTEFSRYGRRSIRQLGINSLPDHLFDLPTQVTLNRPFKVVCMFQILEHLDRLHEVFAVLNKLTDHGSHMFISVPSIEEDRFLNENDGLLYMPPNHIGLWSKAAFKNIGDRFGWDIVDYEKERSRFWRAFWKTAKYRYLRAAQREGTVSSRVSAIKNRIIRRPLEGCMAVVKGAGLVRKFPELSSGMLGASQWVHLRRSGESS